MLLKKYNIIRRTISIKIFDLIPSKEYHSAISAVILTVDSLSWQTPEKAVAKINREYLQQKIFSAFFCQNRIVGTREKSRFDNIIHICIIHLVVHLQMAEECFCTIM